MPFAGYSSFEECESANSDKEDPAAYCAEIQRQAEKLGDVMSLSETSFEAAELEFLVLEDKAWVPYEGPEGGEGWQNTENGDVIYQDEPPGEELDADEEDVLDILEDIAEGNPAMEGQVEAIATHTDSIAELMAAVAQMDEDVQERVRDELDDGDEGDRTEWYSESTDDVPRVDDTVVERWSETHSGEIETQAEELGMDEDEYKEAVEDEFAEMLDEAVPAIRVPQHVLGQVLGEGRFKTQFETGTSSGMLNPGKRRTFEDNYMNVDEDVEDEERPIYGYATTEDSGISDEPMDLDGYGSVSVRLSEEAKKRATVTDGDSLGANFDYADDLDEPDYTSMVAAPAANPQLESVDVGRKPTEDTKLEQLQEMDSITDSTAYTEMQLHGQVTVDDIETVVLGEEPDRRFREALESNDIEWEVKP